MTVATQNPQFWSDWEKTSQNFLTTDINIGNFCQPKQIAVRQLHPSQTSN